MAQDGIEQVPVGQVPVAHEAVPDATVALNVENCLRGRGAPHFGHVRAVSESVRVRCSKAWPQELQRYS